jgi:hypothetical protein
MTIAYRDAFPVAVAFFYGSMSILEGKVKEAPARIEAVCIHFLLFSSLFPKVSFSL